MLKEFIDSGKVFQQWVQDKNWRRNEREVQDWCRKKIKWRK